MIVGITVVKTEAGIIDLTLRHHLAEGFDHILVLDGGSTDGTVEVARSVDRVTVLVEPADRFEQPDLTARLAGIAADMGADWVVPFDADEFFYATQGGTVADRLHNLEPGVTKATARMFVHVDWDRRHPDPKPLPKVAFRPVPGAVLDWGNHNVELGGRTATGVIDLREWQYRSLDHLAEKVNRARVMFAAMPDLHPMHATHMRRLIAMTDTELATEWEAMCTVPTVHDPIPSHA